MFNHCPGSTSAIISVPIVKLIVPIILSNEETTCSFSFSDAVAIASLHNLKAAIATN